MLPDRGDFIDLPPLRFRETVIDLGLRRCQGVFEQIGLHPVIAGERALYSLIAFILREITSIGDERTQINKSEQHGGTGFMLIGISAAERRRVCAEA